MTTYIQTPDMPDSLSRITLNGKEYLIRFTYNAIKDYWTFGLHDINEAVIIAGVKIVPKFPLTCFYNKNLPSGVFGCLTSLEKVGRDDFKNGNAVFCFIPKEDLEEE